MIAPMELVAARTNVPADTPPCSIEGLLRSHLHYRRAVSIEVSPGNTVKDLLDRIPCC